MAMVVVVTVAATRAGAVVAAVGQMVHLEGTRAEAATEVAAPVAVARASAVATVAAARATVAAAARRRHKRST